MAANRREVDDWIEYAKNEGYKYIISVCDTFDYDDYPVYCKNKKDVQEKYPSYTINMQRVNEIIKIDGNVVTENLSLSRVIND